MATDSYWERGSPFSLLIWPLVGRPYSKGRPPSQEYRVNTDGNGWIFKNKNTKLGKGVDLEGTESCGTEPQRTVPSVFISKMAPRVFVSAVRQGQPEAKGKQGLHGRSTEVAM